MKTKAEEAAWQKVLELWPDSIHNTRFKGLLAAVLQWGETIRGSKNEPRPGDR